MKKSVVYIVAFLVLAAGSVFGADAYIKSTAESELDNAIAEVQRMGATIEYDSRDIAFLGSRLELKDVTLSYVPNSSVQQEYGLSVDNFGTSHFERIVIENPAMLPNEANIRLLGGTSTQPKAVMEISPGSGPLIDKMTGLLNRIGSEKADTVIRYVYTPKTGALDVIQFDSFSKLCFSKLSFSATGVYPEEFEKNPKKAIESVRIGKMDMNIYDSGLIAMSKEPVFEMAAQAMNMTVGQVKELINAQLPVVVEGALMQAPIGVRQRKQEILTFFNDPRGLGFHLNPESPQAVFDERKLKLDPVQVLKSLDVSIALNPTPEANGSVFHVNDYL